MATLAESFEEHVTQLSSIFRVVCASRRVWFFLLFSNYEDLGLVKCRQFSVLGFTRGSLRVLSPAPLLDDSCFPPLAPYRCSE
jgi:hypothetical protein